MRDAFYASCLALWLIASFACGGSEQPMILEPPPPGLASNPRWLTFTCVEPGCETTLTATVSVLGTRAVAVKRVILADPDDRERTDFEITPARRPPFVLQPKETFNITVTNRPDGDPGSGDVVLLVTFTDASASDEDMERIRPGELEIPLVRRIIGTAELAVAPEELIFGAAVPRTEKRLPLEIENRGFGNVGLLIDHIETGSIELRVEDLPPAALLPGERHQLSVVYSPTIESYIDEQLEIYTTDTTLDPAFVRVRATSIMTPKITSTPPDGIDFGEVPVMSTRDARLEIANFGAADLFVERMEIVDASGAASLSLSFTESATITALDSLEVIVTLDATSAGEIDALIRVYSNDPMSPTLDVPVRALVAEPRVEVSPAMIDFGAVPRGWTLVRSIEIQNTGWGELTVTQVAMILGSSDLFTLRTIPTVPIRLRHGQRVGIEIEFRSEAEASFSATLSVDSNDAAMPFLEVPISAFGASCDAGCPIANGTPSCTGGTCQVGACDMDWFDADLDPSTGCECREVSNEPGAFCADGHFVGTLVDEDGDDAVITGVLAAADDVDVIRFYGADEGFDLFGDAYDVRVRLDSADPSLRMCVYRKDTGDHLNECYWDNENCPLDRNYRRDGDALDGDGADYVVKIFRDPGAPPSCSAYTLFMSND